MSIRKNKDNKGVIHVKKLTLAVLTALALTATISNTAEAKTFKNTKDIDKVSKQLYKTNLKSYRDKTKTLILNKKTYNKLKKSGRWKSLSGIKSMKSYVKKKYPGVPSSKIQAKCKFSVNYKKSANNGRYRVTLTISDELARVWWMDTHPEEDDYTTPTEDYTDYEEPSETPTETPAEKPQTPEAIAEEAKARYIKRFGEEGKQELAQVQARIDKHEELYERPASDFQKAAIVAGWVDEHVNYDSAMAGQGNVLAGTYLGDCNDFSCMNTDISRCFGLDVTALAGGNHKWNIITVNGVRYEYDATDGGVDGLPFYEISHGQQAEYNIEKYGGKVAKLNGLNFDKSVISYTKAQGYDTYYIMDARTPEYTLHDVYVPGKYYYAVSQYKVSDTIKSKPDIEFGATVISTPELSDERLMEYLEMY